MTKRDSGTAGSRTSTRSRSPAGRRSDADRQARSGWRRLVLTATPSPTTASSRTSAPGSATTAAWPSSLHLRFQHPPVDPGSPTWSGTNTSPMWYGRKIYYLSDQDAARRANIWVLDLDTRQTREVTHFTDYDIDLPRARRAMRSASSRAASCGCWTCPASSPAPRFRSACRTTRDRTRPRVADAKPQIRAADMAQQVDFALAPNGKRVLFSARGDIFSVPAADGPTRDLTSTPGLDEDHPAWSPDGKSVAYTTDVGGGQQICHPAGGRRSGEGADLVRERLFLRAGVLARRQDAGVQRHGWSALDGERRRRRAEAGRARQVQRDPRPELLARRPLAGPQHDRGGASPRPLPLRDRQRAA